MDNRNLYALCQMALFPVTWSDPYLPQTFTFSIFCVPFILAVGEDKDFKFGK